MRPLVLCLTLVLATASTAAADPLTHADLPALDDADVGHLRQFITLARQAPDDWTGWEATDQFGMEAYRYQIAFITYTLALQQYHYTPAYRELYRDTMRRLMERMIQKPVWEFWETTSKTEKQYDPDWDGPIAGWRDPVRKQNIMYSGHVAHMATLYEMFYRDFRWDAPGALTFRWDEQEAFEYDLPKLMQVLHDQMANNPWGGIECEPNAVFPECNQHPVLAFMLYDHTRGTNLTAAAARFKELIDRAPMFDPETHEVVAWYRVKQGDVLSNSNPDVGMPQELLVRPMVWLGLVTFNSASACGWTGAFLHGWQPALVERHYPYQKAHHVKSDDTPIGIRLEMEKFAPQLGIGYFATLAAEVGDGETAEKLLAYADARYEPVWEHGRLRYPRRLEAKKFPTHNLTGKLLALARANRHDGIRQLHQEPWGDVHFRYPLLEGVDFPRVLVRQAHWDADGAALLFTLSPGAASGETTFRITQLDPTRAYTLSRDGAPLARFQLNGDMPDTTVSAAGPDSVTVTTTLDATHQFRLHAEPHTQLSAR